MVFEAAQPCCIRAPASNPRLPVDRAGTMSIRSEIDMTRRLRNLGNRLALAPAGDGTIVAQGAAEIVTRYQLGEHTGWRSRGAGTILAPADQIACFTQGARMHRAGTHRDSPPCIDPRRWALQIAPAGHSALLPDAAATSRTQSKITVSARQRQQQRVIAGTLRISVTIERTDAAAGANMDAFQRYAQRVAQEGVREPTIPADDLAIQPATTSFVIARVNFREAPWGRFDFTIEMPAPADHPAIFANRAAMGIPDGNGREIVSWWCVCLPLQVPSPTRDAALHPKRTGVRSTHVDLDETSFGLRLQLDRHPGLRPAAEPSVITDRASIRLTDSNRSIPALDRLPAHEGLGVAPAFESPLGADTAGIVPPSHGQ